MQLRKEQGVVTAIYYDEQMHEVYVGYNSGEVELFLVNSDPDLRPSGKIDKIPTCSFLASTIKPRHLAFDDDDDEQSKAHDVLSSDKEVSSEQ